MSLCAKCCGNAIENKEEKNFSLILKNYLLFSMETANKVIRTR